MVVTIAVAAALAAGARHPAAASHTREPAPPPASQVALELVRFDRGTGSVLVSGAVPLRPGALQPGQSGYVRVLVGGKEQPAYVEPLRATHRDGTVRSVLVQFRYAVPSGGTGAVLDVGTRSAVARIPASTASRGAPAAVPVPTSADYLAGTEIVGPTVTVREAANLTPAIRKYDQDFASAAERRWTGEGARWAQANYYDRAMIFYVWWARTGDPKYLARGHALALDYRKNYLEANNYGASAHWAMLDGVALHYLLTGDEASRTAVGRVADIFAVPYYLDHLHDPAAEMENRMQARVLTAFVLAHQLRAPSGAGQDWAARARDALTKILASQAPDGAYRFTWRPTAKSGGTSQCGYNKPFMVGILNDALIRYYEVFDRDPRIVSSVRRSIDYMWSRDWLPHDRAFTYLEGRCGTRANPTEWGGPGASPDLNTLIVNGYAWYARQSGNKSYRDRADQIFEGGTRAAFLDGSKQFNQQYTAAHHYIAYRASR